ncbi:uncharacterized protein [Mycetomoellerius zeteki]|uniref:uncharacterized protein n=1 Tax=Mycetomoellerius zeteki TaxID=64791 RepID=UPI00084EA731|nr:PREDICTED: uncharacterized protein LOC108723346 [Trachymyrmex zeteki]
MVSKNISTDSAFSDAASSLSDLLPIPLIKRWMVLSCERPKLCMSDSIIGPDPISYQRLAIFTSLDDAAKSVTSSGTLCIRATWSTLCTHNWTFSDSLPPYSGICEASNEIACEEDIDARELRCDGCEELWLRGVTDSCTGGSCSVCAGCGLVFLAVSA